MEALTQKHYIGNGVVDCQNGHGRNDSLQDCPNDIEDISESPNDDESEGEAICRRAAEVFYDLRDVDDDPGSYGYRPMEC